MTIFIYRVYSQTNYIGPGVLHTFIVTILREEIFRVYLRVYFNFASLNSRENFFLKVCISLFLLLEIF